MHAPNRFRLTGFKVISPTYAILHIPKTVHGKRIGFRIEKQGEWLGGGKIIFGYNRRTGVKGKAYLSPNGTSYIEYD